MKKFQFPTKLIVVLCISCTLSSAVAQSTDYSQRAKEILEATNITGGLIVHIGCGDGRLTAALRANTSYLVHGLDSRPKNVQDARQYVSSLGIYGPVSVNSFDGQRLSYIDNLVNLVVAEDLGSVPMAEVMRVLVPGGAAYIRENGKWTKTVKPWPDEIDEWTHYLHGADGNPVAQDRIVGPPKHYQWISGPLWMRSHESDASVRTLVTARGKLFYIADEAPTSLVGPHSPPDKWFLVARDAFNGILLWKVPIKDWGWREWKPSWFTPRPGDIPLNIQKRLVATGDKVYVTLGYRAAVSELDARRGDVLRTYDGTARTAEILYHQGVLILTVLRDEYAKVVLINADSGRHVWTSENDYGGTTTDYYRFRAMHGSVPPAKVDPTLNTATDGEVIALLDGEDVVCLDFETGKERWRKPFPLVEADHKAGGIKAMGVVWTGTLILQDGVVVHASPNQLAAFSADSGQVLWTQAKKYLQHLWFEWKDVFVIKGCVWTWSAELERGELQGSRKRSTWPTTVNGYDLHTGQLKKKVSLGNIFKTHHHHRCYRNKATSRYILASRRGTEYVDLEQGKHTIHNWVRGTCHLGMMPANGLQYAPPHPCVCYIDEKINGFNALAPARKSEVASQNSERLEKGPAYEQPLSSDLNPLPSDSWPAFRHDTIRSGSVETKVSAKPDLLWQTPVGGTPLRGNSKKLAAPIVVDSQVFVPLVDEHRLVALNGLDGRQQWQYIAGGRIDSPPTYHRGTLLFGSADGWVYCVRAADGCLVWRLRAAPEEKLIGAFGQLESAWPVHGSVLVMDGSAYFAAGRCSHLDGGICLFGVDAVSGKVQCRTKLEGPYYDVDNISQNYQLPMGAIADVLQGDDGLIYMRDMVFNAELEQQKPSPGRKHDRVRTKAAFLDDSYFKRTPWTFGPKGHYGRLIVHDEKAAYFVRMFDSLRGLDPEVYFTPAKEGYLLFAIDRETNEQTWQKRIPVRVNAMVAATDLLFVAGSPDVVDPNDPLGAFEGRKGGVIYACSKNGGDILWQYVLPAPPVFNGLAAANNCLYLAMQDGSVACFGKRPFPGRPGGIVRCSLVAGNQDKALR
jgi:outer membrane protein assembly factor BamB/ubiquinone/menaquinone biosynthesis C-methylase UbiE